MGEPIPLRVIDHPGDRWYIREERVVGTMWRDPSKDLGGREAWVVVLPGQWLWWTTEIVPSSGMWDVSGEPPRITVSPSIRIDAGMAGGWHGWIVDGILVDA